MSFFQSLGTGTTPAFGGTPQNTNQQNTFGAFSTQQTAKPSPFGLSSGFGQSQQQAPNAFANPAQQNTGLGGFGANTNQNSAFGQSAQQSGGFGGFGQGSQGAFGQSSNQGTGAFGGFGQKQGAFGTGMQAQPNQQQQQGGFGGFGAFSSQGQQQQTPFGGSAFGGGSTLGGNTLGASWQQQAPAQPQAPQITPITRLSDLPPDAQKLFEDLEKYITEQKSICEDLKTRSPQIDEYVLSIPADVAEVQKRFDTIFHILSVDTATLNNDLKVKFDLLSNQTQQTIRLLEVLIHPSASSLSYLASTHGAGGDSLIEFFLTKTIEWQAKVDVFKREITEIDRMLKAVEEGQMGVVGSAGDEIAETIRAQWEGFCGMAARVGKLRERAAEAKIAVERGLRGGRL